MWKLEICKCLLALIPNIVLLTSNSTDFGILGKSNLNFVQSFWYSLGRLFRKWLSRYPEYGHMMINVGRAGTAQVFNIILLTYINIFVFHSGNFWLSALVFSRFGPSHLLNFTLIFWVYPNSEPRWMGSLFVVWKKPLGIASGTHFAISIFLISEDCIDLSLSTTDYELELNV